MNSFKSDRRRRNTSNDLNPLSSCGTATSRHTPSTPQEQDMTGLHAEHSLADFTIHRPGQQGAAAPLQKVDVAHSREQSDFSEQALSEERQENRTGLPDALKAGVENLSGYSLDDIRVHYDSLKPAEVQALACTQGTEIHVGPGQEQHLAHEAWHVVQQMQGRVQPTVQMKGVAINDDVGLEREADVMGEKVKSLQFQVRHNVSSYSEAFTSRQRKDSLGAGTIQRVKEKKVGGVKVQYAENEEEALALCRAEAEKQDLNWDEDINDVTKELMLKWAQTPDLSKDEPGGLKKAYELLLDEKREQEKREARKERKNKIEKEGGDYEKLKNQIAGDGILEVCVDWMKDIYIFGGGGQENRTLGEKYTREDIEEAVDIWNGEKNWAIANLKIVKNLHGYKVGPKDPQVGDTLDKREEQGNIIAFWGGLKINIHINPSD